jgi:uncharacterized 2Fe-2S/4Fe-4S cluster protein (DUF4445 family)
MKKFEITFHPVGQKITLSKPTTILAAANELHLDLAGPCGGNGKCGKCKVKIERFPDDKYIPPDKVSKELLTDNELRLGMRLSCTTKVRSNFEIELPSWSWCALIDPEDISEQILVDGPDKLLSTDHYPLEPVIKTIECIIPKPSIDDNISDVERLRRCIKDKLGMADDDNIKFSIETIRDLTRILHENDWTVNSISTTEPNGIEILDVISPSKKGEKASIGPFGLGIDIGTTSIVTYLVDLSTGVEFGVASAFNPQIRVGADILSRIRFAMQEENGHRVLSNMIRDTINDLILQLCNKHNINQQKIYEIVALGNPTMLQSTLGIPILPLGSAPYTPAFQGDYYSPASQLGININKNGKVYVGPLVTGFLGADAVGVALITDLMNFDQKKTKETSIKLVLDIGTNGEILLSDGDRILACSAAAGPAFEGGNIKFGTRACLGAINEVMIRSGRLEYSTIGDAQACGITGSGVVDAISEFLNEGIIKPTGSIDQNNLTKWFKYPKRIKLKDTTEPTSSCDLVLPELRIAPKDDTALDTTISITQNDVREVQLAKAAIRTGINLLMDELNINSDDIEELFLAGAFGNYLRPQSAMDIKLLPPISTGRIKSIGNAAGICAKLLLCSGRARQRMRTLAEKIEYIDLATHAGFQDMFIKNMEF